jgi:hypothetical protein
MQEYACPFRNGPNVENYGVSPLRNLRLLSNIKVFSTAMPLAGRSRPSKAQAPIHSLSIVLE